MALGTGWRLQEGQFLAVAVQAEHSAVQVNAALWVQKSSAFIHALPNSIQLGLYFIAALALY